MSARIGFATGYDPAQSVSDFAEAVREVDRRGAATSATGLTLAGTIADGVLLNTVASPEYSANAIRIVRRCALLFHSPMAGPVPTPPWER